MAKDQNSDLIDIKGLLKQYVSKWYLFVISVIVCAGLAFIFCKSRQRTYGVRANVLIQVDNTNPLSAMGAVGDLLGSKGRVDDEVYVISSHSLLRDVVKDLGINQTHMVKRGLLKRIDVYPNAPLEVITAPELPDTLSTGIFFKVRVNEKGLASVEAKAKRKTIAEVKNQPLPIVMHTKYGDFTIDKTKDFIAGEPINDNISFSGYHAAAEGLALDVSCEIASKKSNAIELAIDCKNTLLGEAILNEMIKLYNMRGIREKNLQGEKTSQFIADRLVILNEGLNDSEIALEEYKRSHGIIDLAIDLKYNTEKKGELEKALLEAETQAEIIRMTGIFLKNPANAYSLVPATIPDMAEAIESYNNIVLKRMELLSSANANNTMLKQMSDQIDAMRNNIITSVDRAQVSADLAVKEIRNRREEADSKLGNIPTQEREYITLKREQLVKQNLYTFLLQRGEETSMLLANAVPKGIVVDEAYTLNQPLGLGNMMIMLIAGFMGICLPPIYLWTRKLLRNKFETREEAEKIVDAPILGEMCQIREKNEGAIAVGNRINSSSSELFRLLRTNLLFMLNSVDDKVVLMTSARSGEGKSFISINLAATLALLKGKRVLLIGMDIRKPQLANYMGIAPNPGLTEYLSTPDMSLEKIIRRNTPMENMDVIVAGPIPPNPSELLASDHVDELFAKLRTMYDYIIIDSAPVGMVSDTFSLNRVADATVFVTRVNHSQISDLEYLNKIYADKRLKKLSVVVNGTQSKQGYGYGYK